MARYVSPVPLDDAWAGLVDDAAIFPPGDAPLHDATAAYGARTPADGAELVGSFVLRDTDLPLVRGVSMPAVGRGAPAAPVSWRARRSWRADWD